MKIILAGLLMLVTFCVQAARTVYVTDKLQILLRSGKGTEYKILSQLKSGTPLTVLDNDKGDGWTYVKTEDKTTGWVLARFLTDHPIARVQFDIIAKKLEALRQEHQQTKEELGDLKTKHQNSVAENQELSNEKKRLIQELVLIRQASSEVLQIRDERDQLQEMVINLERDLQKIKRKNQILEDSTAQDWFLRGAGVLFGGIFLGLIFPKLSWKRKPRSWDTF